MSSFVAVATCESRNQDTDWFPAVDLVETEQEYVFKVDLPGLTSQEIRLEVDDCTIAISGTRVRGSEGGRWLRVERPSGAFIRQLPLPSNTAGEIYGSFSDGVLELRVPKARYESNTRLAQAAALEIQEVVP